MCVLGKEHLVGKHKVHPVNTSGTKPKATWSRSWAVPFWECFLHIPGPVMWGPKGSVKAEARA